MRLIHVVGARPNFMKIAPVMRAATSVVAPLIRAAISIAASVPMGAPWMAGVRCFPAALHNGWLW